MTNLTEFGKILRKHRIDGNLKQQDLAAELDVSPAYLSALETGRKPIRAHILDKIINYMACHLDKLMSSYALLASFNTMLSSSRLTTSNEKLR